MDVKYDLFLPALNAALQNETVSWEMELTTQDWLALFHEASTHRVLPMIYEAVYRCPAARSLDPQSATQMKRQIIHAVTVQTRRTHEFLSLFRHLREAGIQPLVVKGIVCRSLYPNPDHRMSADEDILIPPEQFERCHQAMLDYGMQLSDPAQDIRTAYEVPYRKPGSPLYIELHKSLFPPESDAYGDFNRFFEGAQSRAVSLWMNETDVVTMEYTDHLFYLICHALKHFLHSGFGIRQVCDIVLFANAYGRQIDWARVLRQCREIHADLFSAALFQIGRNDLTFDPEKACYPEEWLRIRVDERMMLADLLDAGIYGGGTMSRKHSSNITLNAVSAQKAGGKFGTSVLKTIFPPVKSLKGRYPYLEKHPYLLPVAWCSRIRNYHQETSKSRDNDAAEAVAIGSRRVELLKQYHILDS
ncbi:MAG: nucleotidyltransferase family protein [Butyricicoccus sp.]